MVQVGTLNEILYKTKWKRNHINKHFTLHSAQIRDYRRHLINNNTLLPVFFLFPVVYTM